MKLKNELRLENERKIYVYGTHTKDNILCCCTWTQNGKRNNKKIARQSNHIICVCRADINTQKILTIFIMFNFSSSLPLLMIHKKKTQMAKTFSKLMDVLCTYDVISFPHSVCFLENYLFLVYYFFLSRMTWLKCKF